MSWGLDWVDVEIEAEVEIEFDEIRLIWIKLKLNLGGVELGFSWGQNKAKMGFHRVRVIVQKQF